MVARYPLKLHRFENGAGRHYKAAIPLEKVLEDPAKVERLLGFIDLDYEISIAAATHALRLTRRNSKADVRAYWLAMQVLHEFLQRLENKGFYLVKKNATLARDLGISESSTEKLFTFYKRFPDISLLDPMVPWNRYRTNKVIGPDRQKSA